MNTRSLAFRLTAWYASLISVVFIFVGVVTFVGLQHYLESNLQTALMRRAEQVRELMVGAPSPIHAAKLMADVKENLMPESSSRFVRISRPDGTVLYLSGVPNDGSFDPKLIAPFDMAHMKPGGHNVDVPGRAALVIVTSLVPAADGVYTVEIGSSLEPILAVERDLLIFILAMLSILIVVAVCGGYFLVGRALLPVDNIAQGAERITHHNLAERLPISPTGDALERLSISVNHMIARLDEAFQNTRRFLADASHELRTPLTIVKGELEGLAVQKFSGKESYERIANVLEEVQRLRVIVEGLFALSRLDAGDAQREWITFDVAELVTSTADQMKLLADEQGISLVCETTGKVNVQGDRSRIKQVVVNLIDNAIKFTPSHGSVRLTVKSDDGHAIVEVRDTGIGIPEESLSRVFERFYRVDPVRSREDSGAGLGLAIVKSICVAHGGTINVSSTLRSGSCFTISLPLSKASSLAADGDPHVQKNVSMHDDSNLTLLVKSS